MVKPYQRIVSLVCIACETCECEKCNVEDLAKRIIDDVRADAIDEVFKKLYDIRDNLPFKYSEHWTSRDSDAISTLFIEYEKQLKEQNNDT